MSPSCRFYHIKMCTPRVLYRTKNYHGWFHLNFWHCLIFSGGFSDGSVVKNPPAIRRRRFNPWVGKIPWRRRWQSTPVFLPKKSHGQRSLAEGMDPWAWSCSALEMTEHLHTTTIKPRFFFCSLSLRPDHFSFGVVPSIISGIHLFHAGDRN